VLLALLGITTLFGVLIAVCLFLRRTAGDWRGEGDWSVGGALGFAGVWLVSSSVAVERAARCARAWRARAALRWLASGALLGLAFLGTQVGLWTKLWQSGAVPAASGYAAAFFALTGAHAAHVLGGLVYFGVLGARLRAAAAVRREMPSLRAGALYWHFMGGLWLVLAGVLLWTR
jgi:cytochrome c oxidase subunit 3